MATKYKKRTSEEIRQETKELTQQAVEAVQKFTNSPEDMKELMDFMSKFPERSFRNQVLIQQQFPGAQACLGKAALSKEHIFIKKGEHGNKIFVRKTVKGFYDKKRGFVREKYATKEDRAKIEKGEIKVEKKPYYTIEKVFDISQTQLKPEDYPKIFPNRVFNFQLDEKGKGELKQGISVIAKELNIQIKDMREGALYRGELGSAKGAYIHDRATNQEEIILNSRNTETHNLSTSIHELAHAKLHKQSDLPMPIKELQAEMTSYIVNKHFGMDTSEKAIPYIASWTNNGAALNIMEPVERGKILNDVSRVANQFIQTISTEINQQREIEIERNTECSSLEKETKQAEEKQTTTIGKDIPNDSLDTKEESTSNVSASLRDEIILLNEPVWVDKMTGKVSHDDTGRCLLLNEGKYIERQDHVQLSGKVFNQEMSTTLTKEHFFKGYPFKFPIEKIKEIQNEHKCKGRIMAEQQKQLERS